MKIWHIHLKKQQMINEIFWQHHLHCAHSSDWQRISWSWNTMIFCMTVLFSTWLVLLEDSSVSIKDKSLPFTKSLIYEYKKKRKDKTGIIAICKEPSRRKQLTQMLWVGCLLSNEKGFCDAEKPRYFMWIVFLFIVVFFGTMITVCYKVRVVLSLQLPILEL